MAEVIGSPEKPYSAHLAVLDDTGLTITVTTGGTYQGVLHATTMVKAATDVGLTSSATAGTISVPVGASGRYRVTCSGVALPTNSRTVLLRLAVDGANLAATAGAGGTGARIVGAAAALEEHFSFHSLVDVDTSAGAKAFGVNVTSSNNSDTVNFKRFNFSVERIGA
jgi:hypothetical protein